MQMMLMMTSLMMTSLLLGDGAGGVLRHRVHRATVVSRLPQQVHVVARSTPLRQEANLSHRSATCVHWLRHFGGDNETPVNVAIATLTDGWKT